LQAELRRCILEAGGQRLTEIVLHRDEGDFFLAQVADQLRAAAALHLAGANKACDLNLLGVIEPHPRQKTLEVRCLPMSLNTDAVLSTLNAAERLLREALG
jgi:hypothetical protein